MLVCVDTTLHSLQLVVPHHRKDVYELERVQHRIAKMIPRLRNESYEERVKEFKLFSGLVEDYNFMRI